MNIKELEKEFDEMILRILNDSILKQDCNDKFFNIYEEIKSFYRDKIKELLNQNGKS